jgi:hypothetical protein
VLQFIYLLYSLLFVCQVDLAFFILGKFLVKTKPLAGLCQYEEYFADGYIESDSLQYDNGDPSARLEQKL